MMRTALTAIAAVALLAGCSAGSHASPGTAHTTTAAPAATASPSPAASPSVAARRLTRKQAAAAYVRIVDPGNAIGDAIGRDLDDKAPYNQYRADSLAFVKETRSENRQLRAIRWPAKVQPYIDSWLLTYGPANIRCYQAAADAGSYAAANQLAYTNQDCVASDASTIPDTIRSMLRLPPRS